MTEPKLRYIDFQIVSEAKWRKESVDLIIRVTEELLAEYDDCLDRKALMSGFRKKLRRILNRND